MLNPPRNGLAEAETRAHQTYENNESRSKEPCFKVFSSRGCAAWAPSCHMTGSRKEHRRTTEGEGLHLKQAASSRWWGEERRKEIKRGGGPTDGRPIQRKCQKDSQDSRSTCERARPLQMADMYRDDEEPLASVSASAYFQGHKRSPALKQLRAARSFVQGVFVFAERK